MTWFIYFGRLEKEKWFDAIVYTIRKFLKKWELPFSVFIFGSGSYENDVLELTQKSKNVHFFGWKPLSEVKRYVENCNYCLMPSTFLETFWLTALTAISRWLPAIWYKKGGLIPFIEEEHNLENYEWLCTNEKLFNCVSKLITSKQKKAKPIVDIKKYSKEQWIINLLPLIGKHKKILLVSDFVNKVWWIETYIHDVKELLESHWYEVDIRWWYLPKWRRGKIKKLFWIGLGTFNILWAIRFFRYCKKNKPDLIWFHSVLRWYGWLPVLAGRRCAKETWMMYHDFWYFYPFPKKLLYKKQVKTPLTFFSFLSMAKTKLITMTILVIGKYISLHLLKKQLFKVDKHIVPSEFLVDILHNSHTIPKKKIFCLQHFLQD